MGSLKVALSLMVIFTFVSCGQQDKKSKKSKSKSETSSTNNRNQTIYLQEQGGQYHLFSDVLYINNDDFIMNEYVFDNTNGDNQITLKLRYYQNSKYYLMSLHGTYNREGNKLLMTYIRTELAENCPKAQSGLPSKQRSEIFPGDVEASYKFSQDTEINFYDRDYYEMKSEYANVPYAGRITSGQCNYLSSTGFFDA